MNNMKEKIDAIYRVCENWAYKKDKFFIISQHDLASDLNNYWYSKLFFPKKLPEKNKIEQFRNSWAIRSYALSTTLWGRVTRTVRKIKGAKIENHGAALYYIIPIKR